MGTSEREKKRASDTPDTGNVDRAKRVRVGMADGDVEMADSDVTHLHLNGSHFSYF